MATLPDIALLDRNEAYEAINDPVSGNSQAADRDAEVFLWVSAVSRRVDELCGPVVGREVVERHHGGVRVIRFRTIPVLSVTQVTAGGAVVDSDLYDLDDDNRFVPKLEHVTVWPSGRRNITVTFQAGRAATTADVPATFKLAAATILTGLWAKYGGAWARGGDPFTEGSQPQFFDELTHNVKRWLGDELLPPTVG